MDTSHLVKSGEHVVLRVNDEKHLLVFITPDGIARFSKKSTKVPLSVLIGKQYGSFFEVKGGKLQLMENKFDPTQFVKSDESGQDNRNLVESADTQKLTSEEINKMKEAGEGGENIIKELVNSSATYKEKTEYSQEKYLKKKQKKYLTIVQVLRTTCDTVSKLYFSKNREKILYMRPDTLGQLLCYANVQAHQKLIVYEECSGLVVGSAASLMAGQGKIYKVNHSNGGIVQFFNLNGQEKGVIENIDLKQFVSNSVTDQEKPNLEASSLIIATAGDPLPILESLYPLLQSSGCICIYSQYIQYVAKCFIKLKYSQAAVNIILTETWLRDFQVLPNRTRPNMQMSGASGFLMTGIKVESNFGEGKLEEWLKNEEITSPNKKQKLS